MKKLFFMFFIPSHSFSSLVDKQVSNHTLFKKKKKKYHLSSLTLLYIGKDETWKKSYSCFLSSHFSRSFPLSWKIKKSSGIPVKTFLLNEKELKTQQLKHKQQKNNGKEKREVMTVMNFHFEWNYKVSV